MTTEATLLTSAVLGQSGRHGAGSPLELDRDRVPGMHSLYVSDPDDIPVELIAMEFIAVANLGERIGVGC